MILPNGNHVFISYEGIVRDLSGQGGDSETFLEDSIIQEVSPAGEVILEWNSWNDIGLGEALRWLGADYAHANSVFAEANGDYLVSLRGTSHVVSLDRSTGGVRWKLGGTTNQFEFIDDPLGGFCGLHTVSRVPSGNILVFDNGFLDPANCPPGQAVRTSSRVAEYDVNEESMTARLVWSYANGDFTRSAGSAQRLENGNTLIGWGRGPVILASEVNAVGVVYEVRAAINGNPVSSYRVLRFDS